MSLLWASLMSREQSLVRGSPRRRNRPWVSLSTACAGLFVATTADLHRYPPLLGTSSRELRRSLSSLPWDSRRSRARGYTSPPAPTRTAARPASISNYKPGTLRGIEDQPSPRPATPAPPSTHPPTAAAAAVAACLSQRVSGRPCVKREGKGEGGRAAGRPVGSWGGARNSVHRTGTSEPELLPLHTQQTGHPWAQRPRRPAQRGADKQGTPVLTPIWGSSLQHQSSDL